MENCARVSKRMGVIASCAFGRVGNDSRLELTESYGLRLLELRPLTFTRGEEIAKRALDAVAAAVSLLLLSPLLGVVAVLVKLSSKGPVLYRSSRVGKGGRPLHVLQVPLDARAGTGSRPRQARLGRA